MTAGSVVLCCPAVFGWRIAASTKIASTKLTPCLRLTFPRAKLRRPIFLTGRHPGRRIGRNFGRNFLGISVLHSLCRTTHQNFSPNSSQLITPCLVTAPVTEISKFHLRELLGRGVPNHAATGIPYISHGKVRNEKKGIVRNLDGTKKKESFGTWRNVSSERNAVPAAVWGIFHNFGFPEFRCNPAPPLQESPGPSGPGIPKESQKSVRNSLKTVSGVSK